LISEQQSLWRKNMNEIHESLKSNNAYNNEVRAIDPDDEMKVEIPLAYGLREGVRKLLDSTQQRKQRAKQTLAKDRTRSFVLLICGTVVAMLLFIGLFSTPARTSLQQSSSRETSNRGSSVAPNPPTVVPRVSVTPLLAADVHSNDGNSDQLSPADIQGTSRQTRSDLPSSTEFDPLAAYRLNNSAGTRTYGYGGPPPLSITAAQSSETRGFVAVGPVLADDRPGGPPAMKSSIVFVRSTESAAESKSIQTAALIPFEETLLPPGTRLLARLESAVTTAIKMPVVASVEYNYERDGMIVVPAGAKVFGDIQQASREGYLDVRFHTLHMPNGREEKIEGSAVALDQKPIKGEVSGKNTAKKILSRTLSGVGTVAAYVVGSGAGLGRTITGQTLLRDRLAGNIALAGEQELMNAAYSENVTVTTPANTRFYVVLQKPAVNSVRSAVPDDAARTVEVPTVQELRELMDLRREINRMYQESNRTPPVQ
jgi:hypothetical protein